MKNKRFYYAIEDTGTISIDLNFPSTNQILFNCILFYTLGE
jgi:hypothetical protein